VSASPNVLVVEDLDFWQHAIAEALTDAGYRVCMVASYDDALVALSADEFHVAVIDPVLDDADRRNRDGLRVLDHILSQSPHIAAMVVTSSDPNRIRYEVGEMSSNVPLLWKDEWDDDRFMSVVCALLAEKER
jgi:DNA-binding NtrC family response regulator